jgi:hypothetical protein
VRVDDEPFLEKLEGAAVPIDPGEHVLRVQHGDDPPIEETIIVREGEKNRQVTIHLQPIVALLPPSPVPVETPKPSPSPARNILAFTLLGAGAVSVGFGVAFEVAQVNEFNFLKNGCSLTRSCMQSQVDTVQNERIGAAVFFAGGGVAAAVGAVVLMLHPSSKDARPAQVGFEVVPARGGGAALVNVKF